MRFAMAGKRWAALCLAVVSIALASSLVFYSQQVFADQCSINGRDCYIGYFFGGYDGGPPANGTRFNVISSPAMLNVNNAEQLIANVASHMACSGGTLVNAGSQNGTGAAFIILTMLDYAPGTSKNVACQQFGRWADLVRSWAPYTNYNVFYDFGGLNTRSTLTDVAYYPSAQSSAWSIVFYHPVTGQPLYGIKKDCANPVGVLQALPTNYALTPRVDNISPTEIESGTKMTVQTSVDNVGEISSPSTRWEITQITVQPGKKAPHEDEGPTASGEAPCQIGGGSAAGNYFRSADAACRHVTGDSGIFNAKSPADLQPNVSNWDIGDVPVGTRICFTLSVQPRSSGDGRWGHSMPRCTVVGKKPKVQIWGGDIAVRGSIDTSTTRKAVGGVTQTLGSWVEYGAFSIGVNNRFASGAGLNGQEINDQVEWSNFTFANQDELGAPSFGRYTSAGGLPLLVNVKEHFAAAPDKQPVPTPTVDLGTLTFATGGPIRVYTAGDLTIRGGDIPPGRSVVILATGTVTITDLNIAYRDEKLTKPSDIPQVVIIANNILVNDSVSRIDAWLVADGAIDTCANVTDNLTSEKCKTLLEVNGPVITNRLILKRTAGSNPGAASGDPAERFNLRPDVFVWAKLLSGGSSKAQTIYTVELPPRF
jgi:hypothetical protein